jgi:hypothetical protein
MRQLAGYCPMQRENMSEKRQIFVKIGHLAA